MVFALLFGVFVTVFLWGTSPLPLSHHIGLLGTIASLVLGLYVYQDCYRFPDHPYGKTVSTAHADYYVQHRALIRYVQQHPTHQEGWTLLAKSYRVLGETKAAQFAASHAKTLSFGN